VAFAIRGHCPFSLKARFAQAAGYTALLIIDNPPQGEGAPQAGEESLPLVPPGLGPEHGISIPVVMISKADGVALVEHLEGESEGETKATADKVSLEDRMRAGSIRVRRKVMMNVELLSEDGAIADLQEAQRMARREREEEEQRQQQTGLVKMALRMERDLEEVVRTMEEAEKEVEEAVRSKDGENNTAAGAAGAAAMVKVALGSIAAKHRQLGMVYMQVGDQNKARMHLLEAAHLSIAFIALEEQYGSGEQQAAAGASEAEKASAPALLPCSSSADAAHAASGKPVAACGSSEDIGRVARAFKDGIDPLKVPLSELSEAFPQDQVQSMNSILYTVLTMQDQVPILDRDELPAHLLPRGSSPLTEVQQKWRDDGYVVLPNFIPEEVVDSYSRLRDELKLGPKAFPTWTPYTNHSQVGAQQMHRVGAQRRYTVLVLEYFCVAHSHRSHTLHRSHTHGANERTKPHILSPLDTPLLYACYTRRSPICCSTRSLQRC
jgi:hypothetical protein